MQKVAVIRQVNHPDVGPFRYLADTVACRPVGSYHNCA
jgi:hypothetical protein